MNNPTTCDIFCNVIDNYGDIGVSWRLARQLANDYGLVVRLFVDDLASFAKLCPEADPALEVQQRRGVEVRLWSAESFSSHPLPACRPPSPASGRGIEVAGDKEKPRVVTADLVIDAFGCALPDSYLAAMTARTVWINLEYLSAEDWVEGCHRLPSPKPPLTRYFFFPGFTKKTGGLLIERDLLARRDAFLTDSTKQQAFWQSTGIEMPTADILKISLFAYENEAFTSLFDAWVNGNRPVLCLVPEGRILPLVRQYFGNVEAEDYSRGNLQLRVLPFVEQERYDELLWACDVNFVRGEDSCVRAQWAGKPFVWQIYPQHDAVHWDKLQAFLDIYHEKLSPAACDAVQNLWRLWNGGKSTGHEWAAFAAAQEELNRHAVVWAQELSQNNLALNLLDFFQEIGRMRAFEIEEQRT